MTRQQLTTITALLLSSAAVIPPSSATALQQQQEPRHRQQQRQRPAVRQRRTNNIENHDILRQDNDNMFEDSLFLFLTTEAPLSQTDPATGSSSTTVATSAAATTATSIAGTTTSSSQAETTTTASTKTTIATTSATKIATTVATSTTSSTTATSAASSTYATDANGDPIVNPGGTCGNGKGDRGNGICANGKCCSKHGWCGTTPAHCDGTTFAPTLTPTPPPITPQPTTQSPTATPTTGAPTTSPTKRDFANITPGHKKFCGPKYVGGFEIAKATCSAQTECGKEVVANHYGGSGNDCPKNFMCFSEIICEAPTSVPSTSPSVSPSTTMPSSVPSVSYGPTKVGQTKAPTVRPTFSLEPTTGPTAPRPPTVPPANLQNSITTRGSFCGVTFSEAVSQCTPAIACDGDRNCNDGEECWPNISCTYHVSEASSENHLQGNGEKDDGTDDLYGTEFDSTEFGEEYAPEESSAMWKRCTFCLQAGMIAGAILSLSLI